MAVRVEKVAGVIRKTGTENNTIRSIEQMRMCTGVAY